MVRKNRDKKVQNPNKIADQTVEEYTEYGSSIMSQLFWGTVVAVGLVVFMKVLVALSSHRNDLGNQARDLYLPNIPSDAVLSAFGVLVTITIALQVMVRASPDADPSLPRVLARRQFMVDLCRVLVPSIMTFGVYVAAQSIIDPSRVDLVRLLGPIFVSALIAFFAADAGVTANPELGEDELRSAWTLRRARLLDNGWAVSVTVFAVPTRKSKILQRTLLYIGPAVVATPIHLLMFRDFYTACIFCVVIFAVSVGSCELAISVFLASATKAWADLVTIFLSTVSVHLSIVAAILFFATSPDSGFDVVNLVRSVSTYALAFLVVGGFVSYAISSRSFFGATGLLRQVVLDRLSNKKNKLVNLTTGPQQFALPPARPLTPLPQLGLLLVVFPPIGLITTAVSRHQIQAQARDDTQNFPDAKYVGIAIGLNIVIGCLALTSAFVVPYVV